MKTFVKTLSLALAVNFSAEVKASDKLTYVSLNYDDSLLTHLTIVVPQLDRFNFKGTFYPTINKDLFLNRLDDWRAIATNGHELGNHTLYHSCRGSLPNRKWVKPEQDLDRRTIEHMVQEIKIANAMLRAVDGQTERTFTPPCFETQAKDGDYYPHIKSLFVGVKKRPLDPNKEVFYTPVGQTGQQLIDMVTKHKGTGKIISFTFHGVGGDYLEVSKEAHLELLKFLDKNRQLYGVNHYKSLLKSVNKD
ncbi:polysaccharide deacetylase family protein [Paraferrimonas sp. SM1919]|uniref:polysaccharide deacetylase family protein n=1 Tax=Paraferrimonas sp. SM1919 TaxID=2662263 RepID=UPI0013D24CE2|nr:polysaccharide deacetylase family protein [Paraferrimonas sp. SM1919]